MAESDEQLLLRFVGGDPAALGELATRHERALLGLALGLLGKRELALDAMQESWVRVIRFAGTFAGGSSVKTWLYRILLNQCRTLACGEGRREAANGREAGRGADPQETNRESLALARRGNAARGARVSGTARADDAWDDDAALRAAVETLDEDKRRVIVLCYHAALSHDEAAAVLEIPLGTLKSRLHAALGVLRERLAAEGPVRRSVTSPPLRLEAGQ